MNSHWAGQPLLDALLWNSEEALICFQIDGMITVWNRAAELLYGFSASEVLGKHISAVLPLYQRPAIEELLHSPLRIESGDAEASERIHKQGMHIPIRLRRSLIRGANGEALGFLERTRARPSSLSDCTLENHFRLMVEQMPVVFWTTDQRLRITSHWGSSLRSQRNDHPIGQSIHEYLGCQSVELPVKQHRQVLRGLSSRFELKCHKRTFDVTVEPLRDSMDVIIGCIGVALDITDRKRKEDEIRHHATHDGLTGLVNFREFLSCLEREVNRAERSRHSFGLLLLDLDDLKGINDRFGHLAGNRALKRLAQVTNETCRVSDIVARYGGDEFAVLLLEADSGMAGNVAERIAAGLRQETGPPALSVSIGVAIYPADGHSAQDLLEAADRRLYRGKRASRFQTAGAE